MKNTILTILVSTLSIFCFGQGTTETNKSNIILTKPDSLQQHNSTAITTIRTTTTTVNDEGTNDPTTTGSVKHIVGGKVVYIKEEEKNGMIIKTVYEPK